MDLVLALPGGRLWAVEVKRGVAPKLERGCHHAFADHDDYDSCGLEKRPDCPDATG